jgi:hypothetical protein
MADERDGLILRLAELGVTEQDWIGMDEMSADALKLLVDSVEQHREMWVLPDDDHAHTHQHDHAPGEPHHQHAGPDASDSR